MSSLLRNHSLATSSAVLWAASLALTAPAQIISINFDNSTSLAAPTMEPTDLAGAPGARVGNWNPWLKSDLTLGDAGQTILDSTGATVAGLTATLSPSVGWASRNNNNVNDQALFSDSLDVFGATRNVAVSGVPFSLYDVYVYVYDDRDGRAGSFNIGATTYYVRGISPASGAEGLANPATDGSGYVLSSDTTLGTATDIDQGNYVKFSNLTGTSFTLGMAAINAGNLDRTKPVGFQIVAVPEPSAAALTGGLVGWLAVMRFRNRR
jgi:hypothetical protein